MEYSKWVEKLVVYFSSSRYEDELKLAKREFFGDVGLNYDDSDNYEKRMDLFFDWYIFSRPLKGLGLTPVQLAVEIEEFKINTDEEKDIFKRLSNCTHSLFEVVKIKGEDVYFKDLLRGTKHIVKNSQVNFIGQKGTIVDVHLIPEEAFFQVTRGVCIHPPESYRFILKELKPMKKKEPSEWEGFLLKLIRMFLKMDQYRHLSSTQVYCNDSPVRF